MEKKEFCYADKLEQLMRTNRFMLIANAAYYIYIAALLGVSLVRGERSVGLCGMLLCLIAVNLLMNKTLRY